MNKIMAVIGVLFITAALFFGATAMGRSTWNRWFFDVQKADDATLYETRRKVEDTCRAMMASYNADKLMYEQYKDHTEAEQRGWSEQAKIRANKTAAVYNEYVLKNSFVWAGNIPYDIRQQLAYLR